MKIIKEHRDWSGTKVKCNRCECEAELTVEIPSKTLIGWEWFRSVPCPVCSQNITFRDPTRAIQLPVSEIEKANFKKAFLACLFLSGLGIGAFLTWVFFDLHRINISQSVDQTLPPYAVETLRKLYASNGMTFTYTNWTK